MVDCGDGGPLRSSPLNISSPLVDIVQFSGKWIAYEMFLTSRDSRKAVTLILHEIYAYYLFTILNPFCCHQCNL